MPLWGAGGALPGAPQPHPFPKLGALPPDRGGAPWLREGAGLGCRASGQKYVRT
ncbi:hypothetical protein STRAU_6302 [Streptomyces aurantiacus JA 4570]|uniref:Uncharacterized protein n=1 Tax=Streptomyces aurantiacus JA 4570 TaxID=1286094 RepID=S3ZQG9_9ACTN|nr:hypothetical protein STRAU_6302 [Streptomyces aurantiacus JA 4570]